MDSLNIVTALRGLIKNQISEVHTSLPVRVTGVDYDAKTVVLESVVKNTKDSENEINYPTFYDVPMAINGGGTGRISFPTKAGDVGVLIFSERDPSNALQTDGSTASSATLNQPCGLYPVAFIPKITMGGDSTESVDPDKVVLSNNKQSYVSLSPDGEIEARNAQGMLVRVDSSGIHLTDGVGTLDLAGGNLTFKGGTANINGMTVDSAGNVKDANGIGLNTHTHPVTGVQTGSSTIDTNTAQG